MHEDNDDYKRDDDDDDDDYVVMNKGEVWLWSHVGVGRVSGRCVPWKS